MFCNRLPQSDDEANVQQVNTTEPMNAMGLWLLLPLGLWVVLWLCAVNWQKLWPVLAQGAWAPAVLLFLICAVVWSRLSPGRFAWQLGIVSALAVLACSAVGFKAGLLDAAEVSVDLPSSPTKTRAFALNALQSVYSLVCSASTGKAART